MTKLERHICIGDPDMFREKVFNSPKIELKGIIKYDPERKGLKNNAACCVVEVDSGISDFYRHQVNSHYGLNLAKPSWGTHISIIQGSIDKEDPLFKKFWRKYDGMEITFKYFAYPRFSGDTVSHPSGDNGWFWFLDIECDFITEIRSELGLKTNFKPHLTIARRW